MKKIGITCDDYKTEIFREGLLEDGYTLEFDGESGIEGVHLFRVDAKENEFDKMKKRLGKTIKRLELRVKRVN